MQQDELKDEILIDGPRLARTFRRQVRFWVWAALPVFGLLLLLALCLIPRSFTSTASLAIQQPSSTAGGALAALTGGGGANKRYLGILKSRQAAEQVERHLHLQQLYGLKAEDDAINLLMKSIKPEDSASDGLLYINVSLPGPPRLSLSRHPADREVKQAAAQAAEDYALALKEYYLTTDNDQGAVLLRRADQEVRRTRADYDDAFSRALNFNRQLRGVDPRSAPDGAPASGTASGGAANDEVGALYTARAQVQAELRANQAARQTREALTDQQIRDLSRVPTDDPLLADARARVKQDQADYDTYSRLYGPENPRVVAARARLQVDQAELARQISGVQRRLTTPNIRSDEEIQALYARQATLQAQIAQAGKRLGVRRTLSGEFARLQTEVAIRLEVLKATETEAAKVRLENAAALNRMSIVDDALPPKSGEPGLVRLSALCVALMVLAFLIGLTRDYLRQSATAAANVSPTTVPPVNGTGPKPGVEPSGSETDSAARRH